MTRAESLAALRHWAADPIAFPDPESAGNPRLVREAETHGRNAVRAVQAIRPNSAWYVSETVAIRESRLAFRCALNAVGLQGAL